MPDIKSGIWFPWALLIPHKHNELNIEVVRDRIWSFLDDHKNEWMILFPYHLSITVYLPIIMWWGRYTKRTAQDIKLSNHEKYEVNFYDMFTSAGAQTNR